MGVLQALRHSGGRPLLQACYSISRRGTRNQAFLADKSPSVAREGERDAILCQIVARTCV